MTPPCLCNSLKTLPFINPRSSRHDNVLSSPAETVQPRAARQTCTAAKVMQGRLNAAIRTFLKTLRTVSCRCAQVHQPGKVLNSNEYPTGAFARIGSQPDSDCAVYPFQTVSISFSYPPVFQQKQISQWLIDNFDAGGKALVLVVDEAHLLDDTMLEELRLMTNANYDRQSPLTLILLGQPLLRLRLKASHFEALRQRLPYRYCIEGLDQDETIKYIQHRLSLAGMQPDFFSEDASQFIFQMSEGLPRRINNACSLALLHAATTKHSSIDASFLKELVDLD